MAELHTSTDNPTARPTWEPQRDGNGGTYARRLHVPELCGWFYQAYLTGTTAPLGALTFAPYPAQSTNSPLGEILVAVKAIPHLIEQAVSKIITRIDVMSGNLEEQLSADATATAAALTTISTDLTAIAAQIAAAVPVAGTVITEADVDAANANAASVKAIAAAANAMVNPVATPIP
jgi:hypothetical protein